MLLYGRSLSKESELLTMAYVQMQTPCRKSGAVAPYCLSLVGGMTPNPCL
jgi:hypothetical protein